MYSRLLIAGLRCSEIAGLLLMHLRHYCRSRRPEMKVPCAVKADGGPWVTLRAPMLEVKTLLE
jgi:hypothetical protein